MGTLVTATDKSNTKPTYTVATVAAGSVVVNAGELALFVGTDTVKSMKQYAAMLKCMQGLREKSWPDPTLFNTAVYTPIGDVFTLTMEAAVPTLTEESVALIQGAGFTGSGTSNSAHSRRMAESAVEFTEAA